ncbi:DUF2326 domain-containing protein [Petralouisia muris]|uniref:DUF2326 domain-containing protein n=1 Tax=Petralouisia muris TaxID=3032872 RepID=A0AC61RZX4_9FIRM|nr:DUF2326 domain-containing protein [Petralouisia muris]TGY97205.1 DUF2326 domain-containing protein [Petralouisia muris]
MFIKKLIISSSSEIIREIDFCSGLNLIIDDTPVEDTKSTGNNVGKTTVLKLVDFCLGAKGSIIYTDTENKKETYDVVKNFLFDEEIEIKLILTENLSDSNAKQLEIQRNFLQRKKAVRKINGKTVLDKDFEDELEKNIMPDKDVEKPSFRQIISHNIRYKDDSINNTLKTLDKFTSDIEYETLYLYLLGCTFNEGAKKQALVTKINQEKTFRERLEKKQTKTTYEIALDLVDDEIDALNEKKASFNLNETLEEDLEQLNIVKYNINRTSALISKLEIRKNLIEESQRDLEQSISHIDLRQLRLLYEEVTENISGVQKTFEDLVAFHNNMVIEKVKYISQDLPELIQKLKDSQEELSLLLRKEKELTDEVAKGDSFEELEKIIFELNEKYRIKGEYESIISQLNEVEENIDTLNEQIDTIDNYLFSGDFEILLKEQVKKFNKIFSNISQELYGEKYALTFKKETNKKEQQFYKFNAFNANMSSGKKQGEILCFDLAYLLFADAEQLPCLHFLLNDKKELMHDNQLIKVAEFVQNKNIQLVISILKDKLPVAVLDKAHIAVELSQQEKLFRIENGQSF